MISTNATVNALSASVAVPAGLTFTGATLGNAASGATFNFNTNQLASTGNIGFTFSLGAGQLLPSGTNGLLLFSFQTAVGSLL